MIDEVTAGAKRELLVEMIQKVIDLADGCDDRIVCGALETAMEEIRLQTVGSDLERPEQRIELPE